MPGVRPLSCARRLRKRRAHADQRSRRPRGRPPSPLR